jgi:hypothetical protein
MAISAFDADPLPSPRAESAPPTVISIPAEFADLGEDEETNSPTTVKNRNVKLNRIESDSGLTEPKYQKMRHFSFFELCKDHFEYAAMRWQKEKVLFRSNWKILLMGVVFQYLHSVATNVAYYLHVQRQPLYDLGFVIFPALSRQMQILSEVMFFAMLFSTILFALSPFFMRRRAHLFTSIILTRFLGVCFLAQVLRCISFLVTALPGPNYHCRPQSPDYAPPQSLYDIFLRQDAFYGCGDLLFSSHTIFVLLCALTYTKYGPPSMFKKLVWALVFFFGCLVVSARKHYSIDIIVAWYTVPLLWVAFDKYYPDRIPAEFLEDSQPDVETEGEPLKNMV